MIFTTWAPMNNPNGVGDPIVLEKYDVVPRGIPGGILDKEKKVFKSDSPLDLAQVHGHKNMIRTVSLHMVSCA